MNPNSIIGILLVSLGLIIGTPIIYKSFISFHDLKQENQELRQELKEKSIYLDGYKDGNTEN